MRRRASRGRRRRAASGSSDAKAENNAPQFVKAVLHKMKFTQYKEEFSQEKTIEYLEENWTERELKSLAFEIEKTLSLISHNPNIFQVSEIKKDIRRAVISKLNTMYYRVNGETVEILSFFSNRQNPKKRKLK